MVLMLRMIGSWTNMRTSPSLEIALLGYFLSLSSKTFAAGPEEAGFWPVISRPSVTTCTPQSLVLEKDAALRLPAGESGLEICLIALRIDSAEAVLATLPSEGCVSCSILLSDTPGFAGVHQRS